MGETFQERIERLSRELNRESKFQRTFRWIAITLTSFAIITGIILILVSLGVTNNNEYVKKKDIQESLCKIIHNGGTIDEVKQVYNNRKIVKSVMLFSNSNLLDSNYTVDTPLSSILADLLVKHYKQDSMHADSIYVTSLRNMISTYKTIHPFDGLEENQRYYFENIRLKLDSNYNYIQDDLVKLGDELDRKNLLVTKYLNKSETSFWISIIAVFITVILSLWQIIQGNTTKKQMETFFSELENLNKQKT